MYADRHTQTDNKIHSHTHHRSPHFAPTPGQGNSDDDATGY